MEKALPYWSIVMNVLLCLVLFPDLRKSVVYGRRFASVLVDLVLGPS